MLNIFTVDIEDYFHPTEVAHADPAEWPSFPSRIHIGTEILLEALARHNSRGTFFVLGWVAEQHPTLVRKIVDAGHEIGCHSYQHRLIFDLTPEEFREDTMRAVKAIEDACGVSPKIYRAPSFSIVPDTLWALNVLVQCGFTHDSSIYPIKHDRYGLPGFSRHAKLLKTPSGSIIEVPIAVAALSHRIAPVGGGAYLRLFPYRYMSAGIRRINQVDRQPACVYVHPWEMDPAQPQLASGLVSRLRTYSGLPTMPGKILRLLRDFRFGTVSEVHPAEVPNREAKMSADRYQSPTLSGTNKPDNIRVRDLTAADHVAWDDFVLTHRHGSPFHLQAWRETIDSTFGYSSCYSLAIQGNQVRGVLPLFLVKNVLVRKALISSPFAVHGGILADCAEVARALYDHAQRFGESIGVQYVELRNAYPDQCVESPNVERYVTFTQTIGPDEEAILESIPRKTRYMVRKSLKHDYSCVITTETEAFETLYSQNLRRLGTPSFPPQYFKNLLHNFGNMVDIREFRIDGKVVAAVLSFYFRDQVLPYYGASDPAYNSLAPNNFMYYDLMRWAGRNGFRTFDFGRSKKNHGGSYDFKVHWGMKERPLPYEMILVKRKTLPNFSPTNPLYQLPIKIWQHVPLPVTRALGSSLIRLVP